MLPPGVTVCCDGEMEIEKSNCGAGGETSKLVLFALLKGLGSPFDEIVQVNVCVPTVATHGVWVKTSYDAPVGPGKLMAPDPHGVPSIRHSTRAFWGNEAVVDNAVTTIVNVTASPTCGVEGSIPTDRMVQSVATVAAPTT